MAAAFWSVASVVLLICHVVCNCPNGFVRHGSTCYHFSHDQEEWAGAMTICKFLGGQLVEIEDATEESYLSAQAKLMNRHYWIALTDIAEESVWVWMNSKKPSVFTSWPAGQPDNSGGNENCAEIQSNGVWNDAQCKADNLYYICEIADEDNTEVVG